MAETLRRRAVPLLGVLASIWLVPAADAAYVSRSELPETARRSADYRIAAGLDPAAKRLTGDLVLVWTNHEAAPARDIHLHLYLNAFRNNRSTFMRESRDSHRFSPMEEGEWGWIDLLSVRVGDGPDIVHLIRYAQPDDGNADDRTVAVVPLADEVPPGGSVTLLLEFEARLPHAFARTGQKGNFYMGAQWYPKPGVFQGEAGWNCHQYHATGEFFSDFASFDVRLSVPQGYVVGATGRRVTAPTENPDGTVTHHFSQADVHDFAWAADPDFLTRVRTFRYAEQGDSSQERELAAILGYPLEDLALGDVDVTLLLQPEHAHQETRIFAAAFAAIRQYGYWYGRYPYDTLTIVDPQQGARGAGGMEYPTLITIGSDWLSPAARLSPEGVTVHEFGHQYWYGLVANNEFEEAWLDEGLTTYSTGKVLDLAFGPQRGVLAYGGLPLVGHLLAELPVAPRPETGGRRPRPGALHLPPLPWPGPDGGETRPAEWLLGYRLGLPDFSLLRGMRDLPTLNAVRSLPISPLESYRPDYLAGAAKDDLVRHSWRFVDRSSYHLNSYQRPALVLHTLERVIGQETMVRALRKYHERFRFRHPTTADFVQTVEAVSGRDLGWLLTPLLFDGGVLDYTVEEVTVEPLEPPKGVFGHGPARVLRGEELHRPGQPPPEPAVAPPAGPAQEAYRNEVLVRRLGSVAVPVVVELEFEDGSTERQTWDAAYRWERIVSVDSRRLRRATVDPERTYVVDANWANNTRAARPDHQPAARWSLRLLLWMQSVLAFYGGLT
jgi:hypothetical protein